MWCRCLLVWFLDLRWLGFWRLFGTLLFDWRHLPRRLLLNLEKHQFLKLKDLSFQFFHFLLNLLILLRCWFKFVWDLVWDHSCVSYHRAVPFEQIFPFTDLSLVVLMIILFEVLIHILLLVDTLLAPDVAAVWLQMHFFHETFKFISLSDNSLVFAWIKIKLTSLIRRKSFTMFPRIFKWNRWAFLKRIQVFLIICRLQFFKIKLKVVKTYCFAVFVGFLVDLVLHLFVCLCFRQLFFLFTLLSCLIYLIKFRLDLGLHFDYFVSSKSVVRVFHCWLTISKIILESFGQSCAPSFIDLSLL